MDEPRADFYLMFFVETLQIDFSLFAILKSFLIDEKKVWFDFNDNSVSLVKINGKIVVLKCF